MKANFLLPFISKSGGVAVVLEYAARLRKRGHEVRVFYPLLPYGNIQYHLRKGTLKYTAFLAWAFLKNWGSSGKAGSWFKGDAGVTPIPWPSARFMPDADAVVATSWPTAQDVARLPASRGGKFYFIQDYEIWNTDPGPVDETYRLPLGRITIAPWLTELMERKFGGTVVAEIHNGIDPGVFHPPAIQREWNRPVFLMMYHVLASKDSEMGLRVLARLRDEFPDAGFLAFGRYRLPEGNGHIEYTLDPSGEKLVSLYQSATIFISASRSEGWGLPVVEAMACGCAVAATRVGCVPILDEGDNLRSSSPGDEEGLFQAARSLAADPVQCMRLAKRGLETAKKKAWDPSVDAMERVLRGGSQVKAV